MNIARALLRAAPIFVLDEPTSALDVKTEIAVNKTLDKLTSNTTTLLISHHLTTTANANEIIYIENGGIVERGKFAELCLLQGRFYQLLVLQCQELGIDIHSVRPSSRKEQSDSALLAFLHGVGRHLLNYRNII